MISPQATSAEDKSAGASAALQEPSVLSTEAVDHRAEILHKFLSQYNSPLANNSENFVKEADANHIDWKLLPAISGVESTFGHAEPAYCYNAWGYNIYGNFTRCFETYDKAIATISHDLRTIYMDHWRAKDVYQIGSLYAASPTWAYRVDYYMKQINDLADRYDNNPLPISL